MEGEERDERVIEKMFCVRLNLAKEAERELLHDPGSGELSRYIREQRLAPQCLPRAHLLSCLPESPSCFCSGVSHTYELPTVDDDDLPSEAWA